MCRPVSSRTSPSCSRLLRFEDSAGWLPLAVVPAPNNQDLTGGVDYHGRDAHRVSGHCSAVSSRTHWMYAGFPAWTGNAMTHGTS